MLGACTRPPDMLNIPPYTAKAPAVRGRGFLLTVLPYIVSGTLTLNIVRML